MTLNERKQWQPVREAIEYLRDAQGRIHDADAWHSVKSAQEYLWLQEPQDDDDSSYAMESEEGNG